MIAVETTEETRGTSQKSGAARSGQTKKGKERAALERQLIVALTVELCPA